MSSPSSASQAQAIGAFISTNLIVAAAAVAVGITTQETVRAIVRLVFGQARIASRLAGMIARHASGRVLKKTILLVGNVLQEVSTWFITIVVTYVLMAKILQSNVMRVSSLEQRIKPPQSQAQAQSTEM